MDGAILGEHWWPPAMTALSKGTSMAALLLSGHSAMESMRMCRAVRAPNQDSKRRFLSEHQVKKRVVNNVCEESVCEPTCERRRGEGGRGTRGRQ